jgi:hypothetical protein
LGASLEELAATGVASTQVTMIYIGSWFFGRPTWRSCASICAVLQRCRPDWDISSAAQRSAWAGDKAGFYPYGKTQAQTFAEQD